VFTEHGVIFDEEDVFSDGVHDREWWACARS
jgi:hypothetical protein